MALATAGGGAAAAQLEPPSTGGAAALDRALQRLAEPRRVLVIGAHPDDEDTSLLALLAQGYGADAAYLSLSRGEGGQNLIGEELGVTLGLLRSQELVAARQLDGARQFFTRAYDFGYSRTLDETSQSWPPDEVLEDVVRIVRRFRPHVIVASWSGTPRDRHGQHQMAGVVARRAFDVADDPAMFPQLGAEEGLAPWRPTKLYRTTFFDSAATTLSPFTGDLDPRTGRSYHQIAMASRSLHRSQDMGQLQRTGPARTRMALLSDRTDRPGTAADRDIFEGIPADSSWLLRFADSLRATVSAPRLADAVPALAAALRRARTEGVAPERLELLEHALAIAAGLVVDAVAAASTVVPGDTIGVRVEAYNGGPLRAQLVNVTVRSREGWPVAAVGAAASPLPPEADATRRFLVRVPPFARATAPYFLERPMVGALYDWTGAPPAVRGLPFAPPLLQAAVTLSVAGTPVTITREVTYRGNDQARGEVRQPVRVVPGLEVRLEPDEVVWSSDGPASRPFTVTLTSNVARRVEGTVTLNGTGGATAVARRFVLERAGEPGAVQFEVTRPSELRRGELRLVATARTTTGETYDTGVDIVAYPHVASTPYARRAESVVRIAPIAVPAVRAVGYVRGASDRVPEALARVGLPVELLDADALARGDLSRFDAIVIGSRAYETDPALVRHNARLLAFVRQGGLLLVQYQQYQFVQGGFAPYRLTIDRPHDRVTDETAAVTALVSDHAALRRPNAIGPDDWTGWPQELGLYFAATWDGRYTPLLELADPGMPPARGGLLVASYGRGTYVYTGLSFFRALPAAVPGAFRLFLNLLALGESGGR